MKGKQELNPLMGQRLALTLARVSRKNLFYIYNSVSPRFVAFPLLISRSVEISRLVEARPLGVANLDAIVLRGLSAGLETNTLLKRNRAKVHFPLMEVYPIKAHNK